MADRSYLRIFRVPREGKHRVRIESDVRGIMTHYVKGVGEACTGPETCKFHGRDNCWKGYCIALRSLGQNLWKPVLLEVTQSLDEEFEEHGLVLGSVWDLWRVRSSEESKRVTGECVHPAVPIKPSELAILPTLEVFYNVHGIVLDVPRPSLRCAKVEVVEMPDPVIQAAPARDPKDDYQEVRRQLEERKRGIGRID